MIINLTLFSLELNFSQRNTKHENIMSTLKKIIATTALITTLVSTAIAEVTTTDKKPVVSDLEVKLSAFSHFQSGFRNQSKLAGDEKNVSSNRRGFAFYNETALFATISNMVNDVTYGGKIVLVPTAKRKGSPDYNGSHIFVRTEYGEVQAGSPIAPSSVMMIDGSLIAAATFDDWGRYARMDTKYLMQGSNVKPSFANFSEFFLDSKLTTDLSTRSYSSEPARLIAYYTPKYEFGSTKLQAGVAYIPDSSNTGADNPGTNSSGTSKKTVQSVVSGNFIDRYEIDSSVKDTFSGGIAVEQAFTDGVDGKVALTGEYGKAAGKAKKYVSANDTNPAAYKLNNLRTYNIGAVLNVGNISCAGSYGSLGKSLTTSEFHKTGRKTDYYTGTVAYKQGPVAASVSYFKSTQYKNTVDAITLGTSYNLAPGFKPYAEVTGFTLKGRPEFNPELSKKKVRGTVALIGAKLSL